MAGERSSEWVTAQDTNWSRELSLFSLRLKQGFSWANLIWRCSVTDLTKTAKPGGNHSLWRQKAWYFFVPIGANDLNRQHVH